MCVCSDAESCLTLCDPVDCSPPGSSVHGILQTRILEWVAISFSRGSSRPRDMGLLLESPALALPGEPCDGITQKNIISCVDRDAALLCWLGMDSGILVISSIFFLCLILKRGQDPKA